MKERFILHVEDDLSEADLIRECLENPSDIANRIVHATSLEAAIAALKSNDFDAVLLDMRLPDGSGVECVQAIRSHASHMPIVVLTGMDREDLALACIAAGAQDYLSKQEARGSNLRRAIAYAITRSGKADHSRADDLEIQSHHSALEGRMAVPADSLRDGNEDERDQGSTEVQTLRDANARLKQNLADGARALVDANGRLSAEIAEHQRAQLALQQTQRLQATGRLAAGVAHHFNNLLMVVLGSIEMAIQGVSDERGRRRLTIALQACERGANLTRQLLSFGRRQMVRPERVAPSRHLSDIAMLFSGSLRSDIVVETNIPDDLWSVEVDVAEFELAALNLAFNARDAMENGGALRLSASNVEVHDAQLELSGHYVLVELSDNGSGIDPDVLPRIFEPFFTTKEVGAGAGLGLSQVHGFAYQAGGAVDVVSQVGEGTTVRLYLPAVNRSDRPTPAPPPDPSTSQSTAGRVLLVDDDVDVAEVAAQMLTHHGYEVTIAHRGQRALEILAQNQGFDLLLSDIVMPGGMNGIELARRVGEQYPNLPILLATAHSDSLREAAEKGLEIITKPYLSADLRRRVAQVMTDRPGL